MSVIIMLSSLSENYHYSSSKSVIIFVIVKFTSQQMFKSSSFEWKDRKVYIPKIMFSFGQLPFLNLKFHSSIFQYGMYMIDCPAVTPDLEVISWVGLRIFVFNPTSVKLVRVEFVLCLSWCSDNISKSWYLVYPWFIGYNHRC